MHYSEGKCWAEVDVRLGGLKCTEYNELSKDRSRLYWVAVQSGRSLSVNCAMCIDAKSYQLDLFVDGKLRHTWVSKESEDIDQREEIEFDQGLRICGRSWWESNMKVSRYVRVQGEYSDDGMDTKDTGTISGIAVMGTLEIRISKPDDDHTHYEVSPSVEPESSFNGQDSYSNVPLTHIITFEPTQRVTNKRILRTRMRRQRSGKAPWVTLTFLYRSEEALRDAGYLKASNSIADHSKNNEADERKNSTADPDGETDVILPTGNNTSESIVNNGQEDNDLPNSHEIISRTGEASILDLKSVPESFTTNTEADHIPESLGNQIAIPSTTTCLGHGLNTAKPAGNETRGHPSIEPSSRRYKVSQDRSNVKLHSISRKSALAKNGSEARTLMPPLGFSEAIPAESALRLSAMTLPRVVVPQIGGGKGKDCPQSQSSLMAAPEPSLAPLNTPPPSFYIPSRQQTVNLQKIGKSGRAPKRRRKDLEEFRARVAEKRRIKERASRRRQEEEQKLEQRKHEKRAAKDAEWAQLEQEQAELEREIAQEEERYQTVAGQKSDSEESE